MAALTIPLARWQFELTWSLLELHLSTLTTEQYRWRPAGRCWELRPAGDGTAYPDWVEPEPDPPPAAWRELGEAARMTHEQPLVEPHVSHFRQVPLRTSVKFAHSGQASPS